MLLGSDNNENNNNNEEKLLNGSTEGHSGLFHKDDVDPDNTSLSPSDDDLVSSSFAVSFKANDPVNTVSEVLKENDNPDKNAFDPIADAFKDDFDDFEFDSSVNPFKPIGQITTPSSQTTPVSKPADPVKEEPSVRKPDEKLNEAVSEKVEEATAKVEEQADQIKDSTPDFGKTNDFPFNPETPTAADKAEADKLLFTDDDPDLKSFAGDALKEPKKDLFNAGNDLDFAASSGSHSDFTKADAPVNNNNDLFKDDDLFDIPDDMKNVNPFKPAAAAATAAASAQVEKKIEETTEETKNTSAFTAKDVKKDEEEVSKTEENVKKGNVHTYGNVSSGVNAFGKRKTSAANDRPAAPAAPASSPRSPFNKNVAPAKAQEVKQDVKEEIKKTEVKADKNEDKAAAAVAAVGAAGAVAAAASVADKADKKPVEAHVETEKTAPAADKAKTNADTAQRAVKTETQPVKRDTEGLRPGAVNDKPATTRPTQRPSSAAAAAVTTSPFAPKGAMNKPSIPKKPSPSNENRSVAPSASQHSSGNIQPVTTVNTKKKTKKEKKKKEAGASGIITLIVVLLIFLLLIWFLDNYSSIKSKFGGKDKVETIVTTLADETESEESETTEPSEEASESTTETEAPTSTPTPEPTDTPTPEPTETEETSETTEPSESTSETTEEPTETTTEATSETTVETTTEPTTEATTTTTAATVAPSGDVVTSFTTHTANYTRLDSGFEFDLILENTGNRDAQLAVSINNISFKLRANSPITSVSSDSFVFNSDSSNANRFIATPNNIVVPAGETYTAHIVVNTESSVNSYGMDSYFIDWNK